MTELSLTIERKITAPAEAVFDAWLNPDMLQKFMLPGDGMSVPKASSDAKEGGRFEVVMKSGDQEMPHTGTYLEINPHSRIVFTWESPFSPGESTVTLGFDAIEGGTMLRLTHERFVDEESRDNHEAGWGYILQVLNQQFTRT